MIVGHGGNVHALARRLGCPAGAIVDMSSNVNPLGPPPGLLDVVRRHLDDVTALPEVDALRIRTAFAHRHEIAVDRVLAGNGTTQFIYGLPRALESRHVLILGPTYSDYADVCALNRVPVQWLMASEAGRFQPDLERVEAALDSCDTVFVCNPNNPTGALIPGRSLKALCRRYPDVSFVVDESYMPFVADGRGQSLVGAGLPNAVVLNSMSKVFRIPGLRIGFLVAEGERLERLQGHALPWSVNALAQAAVLHILEDPESTDRFLEQTHRWVAEETTFLIRGLERFSGIEPFAARTAFILAKLPALETADRLWTFLSRRRILIRDCSNFNGLSNRFIRLSVKTRPDNRRLLETLSEYPFAAACG